MVSELAGLFLCCALLFRHNISTCTNRCCANALFLHVMMTRYWVGSRSISQPDGSWTEEAERWGTDRVTRARTARRHMQHQFLTHMYTPHIFWQLIIVPSIHYRKLPFVLGTMSALFRYGTIAQKSRVGKAWRYTYSVNPSRREVGFGSHHLARGAERIVWAHTGISVVVWWSSE
ncbi:hypothetical protein F5884DRAFT_431471 [Xylogone sp. PMI_703]|nr:hypothetical protein F5884DRAFT_431471 [Xylogone sp. PMI_703]